LRGQIFSKHPVGKGRQQGTEKKNKRKEENPFYRLPEQHQADKPGRKRSKQRRKQVINYQDKFEEN